MSGRRWTDDAGGARIVLVADIHGNDDDPRRSPRGGGGGGE